MWKTSLLSQFRTHKASAVILITLAVLSSTIIVFTVDQRLACAISARLRPATSTLFWRVFYLASPGEAKICLTVKFFGVPPGGSNLTPILGPFSYSQSSIVWSACSSFGTDCGGVTMSSAPRMNIVPDLPIQVVWTIESSQGSRLGDYLLQFGLCRGGGFIGLQIGAWNNAFQTDIPAPLCPLWTGSGVDVTFDGYTGLVPTDQNWPIPLPLLVKG